MCILQNANTVGHLSGFCFVMWYEYKIKEGKYLQFLRTLCSFLANFENK